MGEYLASKAIQKYIGHDPETVVRDAGNYPETVVQQVQSLVDNDKLAEFLLKRHHTTHSVYSDSDLREYVLDLKNQHMKKSSPLSKVIYDSKIHVVHNALGLHSYVSRKQGGKLKAKNELRVSSMFKKSSEALLNMIVTPCNALLL